MIEPISAADREKVRADIATSTLTAANQKWEEWRDRAQTLEARVVELEAALKLERAHWLEASGLLEAYEAHATALLEVLIPFADACEGFTHSHDDTSVCEWPGYAGKDYVAPKLTVRDLRAARAAINAGASYDRK